MSIAELQQKYRDLYNTELGMQSNKQYLIRKAAYKMQEQIYGALSGTAENRLNELIKEYGPINKVGQNKNTAVSAKKSKRDRRVPIPGTSIIKHYKGKEYLIKVLEKGFEYEGVRYKSLSAIAKILTGSHWNGYAFFNL
jgi:hypothetical protein